VTVTNYEASGDVARLNDLVVEADGERRNVASDLGRLPPGAETTVTVPVTLDDPGQYTLRLRLFGESSGGVVNTNAPFVVEVREPQRPSLSVSVPDAVAGASRDVNVTVANGGAGEIGNVEVVAGSPDGPVTFDETERVVGRVGAGETRTFSFPARVAEPGRYTVTVALSYGDDGVRREVTERFDARFGEPANPGRVMLSSVEATQRGGTVELAATASNTGGTETGGVVVTVPETETLRSQTYFVGRVDPSGFSTFTLRTDATGRVSTLPVEVSYVTGGVERSFTTEVAVDRPATPTGPPDRGGPLSALPLPGVAAGLVVLAVGVFVWRRR
jgi:hypothetical protein